MPGFETIAQEFETAVRRFNSVDSLSNAVKEVSVTHARDILERLKFASEEDSDAEKLDLDETKREMAELLLEVAKAFLGMMADIAESAPGEFEALRASPVFAKVIDALGKVAFKLNMNVIDMLMKQGKTAQAEAMKVRLALETPKHLKTDCPTLSRLTHLLAEGISEADLVQKKIAAGLAAQQWQNMPPAAPPKKKEKDGKPDLKAKALDAVSTSAVGYRVVEVSEKALVPAAQEVNKTPDPLVHSSMGYKIAEVSEKGLVESARKANEEIEKSIAEPSQRKL